MAICIDLHTHSSASDGTDSPATLVRKAARLGLAALALTDHDTLAGLEEARAEAESLGLEFVPGVEIAVRHSPGELHLLGLFTPLSAPSLDKALSVIRNKRDLRNQAMLNRLKALGIALDVEEIRAKGPAAGRLHIAAAMLGRGYVQNLPEAFDRYLGAGRAAYVPRELLSPADGVKLLLDAGTIVVLAHPFLYPGMTPLTLDALLTELRPCGLNALEVWHNTHGPDQIRTCQDLARKHNLLVSGGTDYHGLNKKGVALGKGRGGLCIPYSILAEMKKFRTGEV
jgi:predicted metal-dependent phosphoesterase TrpH